MPRSSGISRAARRLGAAHGHKVSSPPGGKNSKEERSLRDERRRSRAIPNEILWLRARNRVKQLCGEHSQGSSVRYLRKLAVLCYIRRSGRSPLLQESSTGQRLSRPFRNVEME